MNAAAAVANTDGAYVVSVALPFEGVVVEVRRRRPHGPEREGVALGVPAPGGFDVFGELDTHRDGEVDIGKRTARRLGALADGVEEDVGGFGEEGVADPSVRQLAGQPEVRRSKRGDVDRNVSGRHERADGASFTALQRQLVDLAVVLEAFSRRDQTDDVDGLAGTTQRFVEADAVPTFHHLRTARADAEHEPAAR